MVADVQSVLHVRYMPRVRIRSQGSGTKADGEQEAFPAEECVDSLQFPASAIQYLVVLRGKRFSDPPHTHKMNYVFAGFNDHFEFTLLLFSFVYAFVCLFADPFWCTIDFLHSLFIFLLRAFQSTFCVIDQIKVILCCFSKWLLRFCCRQYSKNHCYKIKC